MANETANITLTKTAAEHVKGFLAKKSDAIAMRFGVKKSGCAGFAYVLEPSDVIESDDYVFEHFGVKVIVDPKSLLYVNGTELAYDQDGLNSGIKFNNPNENNSCGCGESFDI